MMMMMMTVMTQTTWAYVSGGREVKSPWARGLRASVKLQFSSAKRVVAYLHYNVTFWSKYFKASGLQLKNCLLRNKKNYRQFPEGCHLTLCPGGLCPYVPTLPQSLATAMSSPKAPAVQTKSYANDREAAVENAEVTAIGGRSVHRVCQFVFNDHFTLHRQRCVTNRRATLPVPDNRLRANIVYSSGFPNHVTDSAIVDIFSKRCLLPPAGRLCIHRHLFVCLLVCRTRQKLLNQCSQNSVERRHMATEEKKAWW